jgi:hypothetical protein
MYPCRSMVQPSTTQPHNPASRAPCEKSASSVIFIDGFKALLPWARRKTESVSSVGQ